ncbi:DUF4231 domain-containing protein [Gloeothece verrucosa]|uniref:DUF4231 domain-containing protein n=1 Tax=Gloeothece verrucosa (strain PCC 7822) TaxID=497965 RepID=E0UEZ2_GLOV7|nr:DUF4231 domain-containing protein [Gloeothece verrucosa]ADN14244.1 conserved hypothetical protein [Gloeothece verrucosa PCC 7822]
MANIEQIDPIQGLNTEQDYSSSENAGFLSALKIFEYLLLAIFIGTIIFNLIFPELQLVKLYSAGSAAVLVFVYLIDQELAKGYNKSSERFELTRKAKLYDALRSDVTGGANKFITPARVRALKYSQDLIDDYKKTRETSRNIYYIFQIATIVLSGVTPILVLVDKLETGNGWLKWLPVICPAIAAIVASIVTSFPFQENWVAANTAVELLEAEQEKFILGVTPLYQYSSLEASQLPLEAQKSVENFIVQVNNIHLKQLQAFNEKKLEQKPEEGTGEEQSQPSS